MERIVDRSDLANDAGTPASSPEPEITEKFRALGNLEFVDRANDLESTSNAEIEGDELDFRLFSSAGPEAKANTTGRAIAKIKLRSPSPINAQPGFVNTLRSQQYYVRGPLSETEQEHFDSAAVSGVDVLNRSTSLWPGCSYPWKVLHLLTTRQNLALSHKSETHFQELVGSAGSTRHTRLGKKARIRLRVKNQAAKKRQEKELQTTEEKAEAEREKRNRRNREKKIKRRARDRARKAEAGTESDDPSVG